MHSDKGFFDSHDISRLKQIKPVTNPMEQAIKVWTVNQQETNFKNMHDAQLMKIMLKRLNLQIEEVNIKTQITPKFKEKITTCFDDINSALIEAGLSTERGFTLLKYGSIVNGLALDGQSDLDLTIITDGLNTNHSEILMKAKLAIINKYGRNRFYFEQPSPMNI